MKCSETGELSFTSKQQVKSAISMNGIYKYILYIFHEF